jgi:hypothetical protein
MKKIALSIIIFFFSTLLFSQSDIIYPSKTRKNIRRCTITEVKNINVVYYLKINVLDSMEAIAIVRNDIFINLKSSNLPLLFKNHDYNYYQKKYKRAVINRNIGIGITILGIGTIILSYASYQAERKTGMGCPLTIMVASGAFIINSIGVAIWSSNSLKAMNNKKAMEMTKPKTSLSFGTTNNGIGLVLNF